MLLTSVLNDSLIAFAASIFLSRSVDKLRCSLAKLELEKETEASKFLGPVLSKAIFENEAQRLKHIRCQGLVISIDIRDSTELQKKYRADWLTFRREYFAVASRLVGKHSGYIQKTVGDAHVINFGVMDYGVDLSDIPGIETDLARAEERRIVRASENAFSFLEEFFTETGRLATRHFPKDRVLLGAGIDRGILERGIQGDATQSLELDVNGDAVNCSSRLQEYSKIFLKDFPESSILVVSPYAADFLNDLRHFKRIPTLSNPIRNYSLIKWVLVRSFEQRESKTDGGTGEIRLAA